MNEAEAKKSIEKMTFDEKLKLLSNEDKAYVHGFVDRAVLQAKKNSKKPSQSGKK